MDRTNRLIETIRILMEGEFSGHIKINFTQGSIGRVEKSEEVNDILPPFYEGKDNAKEKGGSS